MDSRSQLGSILEQLQSMVEAVHSESVLLQKEDSRRMAQNILSLVQELRKKIEALVQVEVDVEMYGKMEAELQRQEGFNRSMIKKELESKQYQKGLLEELLDLKQVNAALRHEVAKLEKQLHQVKTQLAHSSNQKKMLLRDKQIKQEYAFDALLNTKLAPFQFNFKDVGRPKSSSKTHRRLTSDQIGRISAKRKKSSGSALHR